MTEGSALRTEEGPGGETADVCFECTRRSETSSLKIRRLKRAYCPGCWVHHCDFRFRKRLFELARPEKGSRLPLGLIRPTEHILVMYDGTESSLALLHLIRDAIRANISATSTTANSSGPSSNTQSGGDVEQKQQQKILPLPFTFALLFIYDETKGSESCDEEKLKILHQWQSETSSKFDLDFPIIVSSLECSLSARASISRDTASTTAGEEKGKGLIWERIPSQSSVEDSPRAARNEEISGDLTEFDSPTPSFPFNTSLNHQLSSLEKNLKSETSKKDFLQILRENLMLYVAKDCGAGKIFIPEEQTSMAIKMFSLMSLGRGAQLAEQMGLTTEIEGVKFVRPLMDLSRDDLRDYLVCLKETAAVEEEAAKKEGTKAGEMSASQPPLLLSTDKGVAKRTRIKAIQEQCEEFIVDLQHGYASTVPTLTRIGAKLRPQGDEGRGGGIIIAKEKSGAVDGSRGGPDKENTRSSSGDVSGKGRICSFCKRNRNDTDDREALEFALCYGCTNILRDMRDPSSFRAWLHEGL